MYHRRLVLAANNVILKLYFYLIVSPSMAKNILLLIGYGMGWEMARSGAI
jgi:hypothetical protein